MARTAKRAARRISNNRKRKVEALLANAGQAVLAGRRDICEAMCREIERLWPDNPDLFNLRGVMRARDGRLEEAAEWFRKAVDIAPKRFEFVRNLGTTQLQLGRHEDAAPVLRQALALNVRDVGVMLNLANALRAQGDLHEALAVLQQAMAIQPDHADVLTGLGTVHVGLQRYEEAMTYLDAALRVAPRHEAARLQKAELLHSMGDLEHASLLLRELLADNPDHVLAWVRLARFRRFAKDDEADIERMCALHASLPEGSFERRNMCFALGKVMEDVGRDDEAFVFYHEGNEIARKFKPFDRDEALTHLDLVARHYTPQVLARASGVRDERPVFIVGMPRCGSTLTEQILAAHPQVAARGEPNDIEAVLADWEQQTGERLTLERITAFSPEEWSEIGRAWQARVAGDAGAASRITDKTLANIRLIGAIHCALPEARIIHVRRHPLDLCWSNFKADLAGDEYAYNYSLSDLAWYCRAYMRLMAHWREVLPEGVMLELDYEELVADQEGQTRRLLEFIGLEWDDACLNFQQADRVVLTSSAAQVREGVRSDAVGRWRRFERHLAPATVILKDELARWPRPM